MNSDRYCNIGLFESASDGWFKNNKIHDKNHNNTILKKKWISTYSDDLSFSFKKINTYGNWEYEISYANRDNSKIET